MPHRKMDVHMEILLDYADDCQALAYSYTMEAELAIMDACDLIDEYEAKYGKME